MRRKKLLSAVLGGLVVCSVLIWSMWRTWRDGFETKNEQGIELATRYPAGEQPVRGLIVYFKHGNSEGFFKNRQLQDCARELELGLVHFDPKQQTYPGECLIEQLEELAETQHRPELKYAPLILVGHSVAFSQVLQSASHYPDRTIGMIGFRTGRLDNSQINATALQYVPCLLLAGEKEDRPERITHALSLLAYSRTESLPVTFALERDGLHNGPGVAEQSAPIIDAWIRSIVALRVIENDSSNPGYAMLKDLDPMEGISGDVRTLQISAGNTLPTDAQLFSWLPDKAFQHVWTQSSVPVPDSLVPENSEILASTAAELYEYTLEEEDWPCWRGVQGDNKAQTTNVPLTWGVSENILWKTKLSGRGHASPIVIGDQIFLFNSQAEGKQIEMICLDANDGSERWRCELYRGEPLNCHAKNSHASATPAGDGQHIYSAHLSDEALWVTAVAMDGEVAWQTRVGDFTCENGFGSSPILYRNYVIVTADRFGSCYIAALDRRSGQVAWKRTRDHGQSFASPVIAHISGRDQLILAGHNKIISYDPQSGAILWHCSGMSKVAANTAAFDDSQVYVTGGHPEKVLLAVRANGSGDVTDSHVVWSQKQTTSYVTSPLVSNGRLYLVNDNGIATCWNTANGDVIWRERLGGKFSSSPVLVGDRIYVTSEDGETFVLADSPEYQLLAKNQLPGSQMATLTIARHRIYARTDGALYCIAQEPEPLRSADAKAAEDKSSN